MPEEKNKCERPELLKGKPQDCSAEQVKQCHGDEQPHPCTEPEPAEEDSQQ